MTKTVATLTEKLEIIELLKAHLHPVEGEEDIFEYDDGWDDRRVSEIVNKNFTASHTASVRTELFGKLRVLNRRKTDGENENIKNRFTAIGNEFTEIHNRLDHIETMLNIEND